MTVSTTSILMTEALCYPETRSLYLILGLSPKNSRRSHAGFNDQYGHDSHDKFNTPGQAGKGLIISEDLLLADASMVFHLQQCRDTVCREGACLNDLHSYRQPSDPKKRVAVTLGAYNEALWCMCHPSGA